MQVRRQFVQTNASSNAVDGVPLDAKVYVHAAGPTLVEIEAPAGATGRAAVALMCPNGRVQGRWWTASLGKPPPMSHGEFEIVPGQTLALAIPVYPDGTSPDTIALQSVGSNAHVGIAWGVVQQTIDLGLVEVPATGFGS